MPQTNVDTWQVIFLLAASQALFIALVFFLKKSPQQAANRMLAALLLIFTITLVEYVCWWTNYIYRLPHLMDISSQLPFLMGPLLLFYFILLKNDPLPRNLVLKHLLPFMLVVLVFIPWYGQSAETKVAIMMHELRPDYPLWLRRSVVWLRIGHLLLYAFILWMLIRKLFAGTALFAWARVIVLSFLGYSLAYASYFILVRFPFFTLLMDYQISVAMTVFIYLIALYAYLYPLVLDGRSIREQLLPEKYRNSGLTDEAAKSLLARLQSRMEEEQLYTEPDLSLERLADELQASKHHVSQVLNAFEGKSFFEYINHFRIEEAKRLLTEYDRSQMHIIEIAYKVGFNNKVSFNNAFKKDTGLTPSAYRQHHSIPDDLSDRPDASGA
ncbi:MAG: AraC family transcriptional regulator [Saprospiraceae bacterium]